MKKILIFLLTAIISVCGSYATAEAWETWYVGTYSGLNCRTAPSADAEILTTYPTGQALQIIGADAMTDGIWWETFDGTTQGWVHSDYLTREPAESRGTYLGTFKITHFCPNSCCNGSWGNQTAWAGEIIPGQTIAVDPSVIGKLQWVNIDGYGLRRAEDCGGGIKGNHIDIAVPTHAEALEKGVVYRDVYLAE